MSDRVAVVTGASSGIGEASARRLASAGFRVVLGARRMDRLERIASSIGPMASFGCLDVGDPSSVRDFCERIPSCQLLLNNAGIALGDASIADEVESNWERSLGTNVLGPVRMTKALLPKLVASGDGHVITIGSVAGFDAYANSGAYVASKHAIRGIMDVLRLELLGQPVRISEIDPGMVETEFSVARFGGDERRARHVYAEMTPLTPSDVAECVAFVATRPSHVDIDQLIVRPRDQARPTVVYRHTMEGQVASHPEV